MAQVIEPSSQVASNGGSLTGIFDFVNAIFTSGFVVLIVILIILGIGVAVFIYMKMQRENALKEKDDTIYAQYKSHLRTSVQNVRQEWIKQTGSLWNILFLGIPLIKKEHSLKVVDLNNNMIGYYRGQTITHKKETIYCLYKTKTWFFFENLFLLRCINSFNYQNRVPKLDNKGNEIKGEYELVTKDVSIDKFYKFLPLEADKRYKKVLEIQCYGVEEERYYFTPSYVTIDEKGLERIADFRPEFRHNLKDYSVDEQYRRFVSESGRAVDGAVRTNPHVQANKHWIEKTEEEVRRDDMTPNKREF